MSSELKRKLESCGDNEPSVLTFCEVMAEYKRFFKTTLEVARKAILNKTGNQILNLFD